MMKRKRRKAQPTIGMCIKGLPVEVKNYFKAHCAKMGKSMNEVITDFMRKTVADARKADHPFSRKDD